MTTATIAAPHGEARIGGREALAQAAGLARRSIRGTVRQPTVWMPGLLFPMFIAAVNSSTMGKAVEFLPGFEGVDSLLQFLLPASITQSVLFGGLNAGSDTATDIQTGFFDRLLASPVARTSILVGRLMGAAVTGAGQAVVFIVVYGIFGVTVKGGVPGMVALVLCAMVLALMIGGFAAMMAMRTGSAEAVQNVFPLTFILLFISSAFFPTESMHGVYQSLAEANPITWVIDGMRHQVVVGFDLGELAVSLGVSAVLAALAIYGAHRALVARLAASS
ncbi:MAG: ABC transporter permease [Acidimicrobiales bacterium]